MSQYWTLTQETGGELFLKIEMESDNIDGLQESFTDFMLSDKYHGWITNSESGVFPPIVREANPWEQFLEPGSLVRCLGVDNPEEGSNFPQVLLQSEGEWSGESGQIFNSDYLNNSRVLRWEKKHTCTPGRPAKETIFSGRIFFDRKDSAAYLKSIGQENVVEGKDLKFVFTKGRGLLYWGSKKLSTANHVNGFFQINGKWRSSLSAFWEITKPREDTLIARGQWPEFGLGQEWKIARDADGSLMFEFWLELSRPATINQQHFQFMLGEWFDCWQTNYGSGEFGTEFTMIEQDVLHRCVPDGDIRLLSSAGSLPALKFSPTPQKFGFVKIFNSDMNYRCRLVRVDRVEAEGKSEFSPGRHLAAVLRLAAERPGIANRNPGRWEFTREGVSAVFENGHVNITAGDKPLTKLLGVYASLRVRGDWQDSCSAAVWRIKHAGEDILRVQGEWLHLPIEHYWELSFNEDGELLLDCRMRVKEKINCECLQMNVMLKEQYEKWQTGPDSGTFPDFARNVSDDWQTVWPKDKPAAGNTVACCSSPGGLPGVELILDKGAAPELNGKLRIVNSDLYHRARVLQYLNRDIIFTPGEHLYFKGKIRIRHKE